MKARIRDCVLWPSAAVGFGAGISRAYELDVLNGVILTIAALLTLAGVILTWKTEAA